MKKFLVIAVVAAAIFLGCNPTGSSQSEIVLRNRTFSTINVVYITACANPSWGSNRLPGGVVISPNAERDFPVEPGCWDIKAEFTDDGFVQFSAIEVGSNTTYTLTATN